MITSSIKCHKRKKHLLRKHSTEVCVSASGKMGRGDSLGKKCNPVSPYLEDEGVALGRSPSLHSLSVTGLLLGVGVLWWEPLESWPSWTLTVIFLAALRTVSSPAMGAGIGPFHGTLLSPARELSALCRNGVGAERGLLGLSNHVTVLFIPSQEDFHWTVKRHPW